MSNDKKNAESIPVNDAINGNFTGSVAPVTKNPKPLSLNNSSPPVLDPNSKFKNFLSEYGFTGECPNIVTGSKTLNGNIFETSLCKKDGKFCVKGHGEGTYSTLEEVAVAITRHD